MLVIRDYNRKKGKFSNNGYNRQEIVFLVWNKHGIRAEGMSKYLGACLCFLFTSRIKHPALFIETLNILRKKRPKIIICQTPPITCALVALIYRFFFGGRLKPKILVDSHRGTFQKPWSRIKFLSKYVLRRVELIIVENLEVQNLVLRSYGVKSMILEDPIPHFDEPILNEVEAIRKKWDDYDNESTETLKVVVINPFTSDAPLQEIFNAAAELRTVATFYITGDFSKASRKLLRRRADNIILTGFLPNSEYVSLLYYVDVIIDLTSDPERSQAGAYEAVAVEKALIISDNAPLRRCFNKGTIHIRNSIPEIKEAIRKAQDNKEQLEREMHELKYEKEKEWEERITNHLIETIK